MNLLYRRRFRVVGIVQGVGFRPHVARLAAELGLAGFVLNTTSGVVIEAEGLAAAIEVFAERLVAEAPAAATIEHLESEEIAASGGAAFEIRSSEEADDYSAGLPPDLALCGDCAREMDDERDRRYRYPFINCTNCGPRYSIVEGLPYDRPRTTMRQFAMCAACAAEYEDARDRRYHAQPVACPKCGPELEFVKGETRAREEEAVRRAVEALRTGEIGAIKGIGGFHLACDARNAEAVGRLRERKARGDQPFAVMVRNLETAREFVEVSEQAAGLLRSAAAPIVLLPKRKAEAVLAPGNGYLGVMLPYSPLHNLLVAELDLLVMTSGNRHGEPIVSGNEKAVTDLAELADFFVLHNREICAACDDSVVRLWKGRPLAIRRGRGYAPLKLKLPVDTRPALAMGSDLKAAFGLAEGRRVYIGPHIGDMENVETLEAFERTLDHLTRLHRITPELVSHDAHPGYLSTQWAIRYAKEKGIERRAIQHHRAHAAAVMAEYGVGVDERVVAVVYDGTGYGDDGAIWGGEFFCGTVGQLERRFHLPYVLLPGGDACAKRPAHSALAHLTAVGIPARGDTLVKQQLQSGLNCHRSSSMGRLFDAAASVLGVRDVIQYEAQAAIEMEALAALHPASESYSAAAWRLDDLWREMLADASAVNSRARRFIGTVARWTWETANELCQAEGTNMVVLGGGVFQNVLLLEEVTWRLEADGRRVLTPRYLPPNDGGLALGQLYLGSLES